MKNRYVYKTGLALTLVVGMFAWAGLSFADNPYWDNSGASSGSSSSNSSFYAPQPSSGGGYNNNGPQNSAPPAYGNGNYNDNSNGSFGNFNSNQSGYGAPPSYGQSQQSIRGYVSTAPAGTSMTVTNTTGLSSQTAHAGDPITVTLGSDISSGGNLILPSGSQIQGEVVSSVPAGRLEHGGQLQLRFTHVTTPDGRSYPLSARLITQDGTGIIKGGTTKGRVGGAAKNSLGGAAIGGLGGTALGALAGGRPLQGLLWGSVLGAGAGLAKTGLDKGVEAEIQPGSQLQIMLDQPLTVSPNGGGPNPY